MPIAKRWTVAQPSPAAPALAARLRCSPILAQILLNRGIDGPDEAQRFLAPTLRHLLDPATLPGMQRASERIAQAIRGQQKIVVYGDYDVDGITATAILWHAIRLLGGQVSYYIPHRLEEGYGLNAAAINEICDGGAQLIITVDCGITAADPVRLATGRGVDVVVTDHHEFRRGPAGAAGQGEPVLPECCAIVHPRLAGEGGAYGNPSLCGAGVAFKLAWGIGQAVNGAAKVSEAFRAFLIEATALAALGTIADVVPLLGENRALAHFGLAGLKASRLVGIQALIATARLTGQDLDSYDVGFLLAPRLNACGRLGHARLAVEMLTDADEAKAAEIAEYLEQQNRSRQAMEKQIFEQAMEQVAGRGYDGDQWRAVVLEQEGWHQGVIGIVASRVVGRLNRPAIMVALSDGQGHGSGRSISGFHLARALEACREHLEAFGGHEMAAGLRLPQGRLEAFREAFCAHAMSLIDVEMLRPELRLDCEAQLGQITPGLVQELERLGPFGVGNRRPLLCCRSVELAGPPRRVGRTGDHLQLLVRQAGTTMRCIAFGFGAMADTLRPGAALDLAAEAGINEYNGYRNVELEVRDVRAGG